MQTNPSKDKSSSTCILDQPSYHGLFLFAEIKNCAQQILQHTAGPGSLLKQPSYYRKRGGGTGGESKREGGLS